MSFRFRPFKLLPSTSTREDVNVRVAIGIMSYYVLRIAIGTTRKRYMYKLTVTVL